MGPAGAPGAYSKDFLQQNRFLNAMRGDDVKNFFDDVCLCRIADWMHYQ